MNASTPRRRRRRRRLTQTHTHTHTNGNRHLIFAPGQDTGYAPTTFPGITEAVEAGDLGLAAEFVQKTAAAVRAAGDILKV